MTSATAMRFPDFVIGGLAKAASSSLFYYLKQHPSVFMPVRRVTNFFGLGEMPSLKYGGPVPQRPGHILTLSAFHQLFEMARPDQLIGDGSSFFNFTERAAHRIYQYNPGSKIIFILRHPADRAFSLYIYARRCGWEPCCTFENALRQEPQRKNEGWFPFLLYKETSLYAETLSLYFRLFGSKQIYICTFDDFTRDTGKIMSDIFLFLGVDPYFIPDVKTNHNPSRLQPLSWFRSPFNQRSSGILNRIPRQIQKPVFNWMDRVLTRKPVLPPRLRDKLTADFSQDILQTESIIGKSLSFHKFVIP